jgi:adenine-specific DNA-methyltransferase
MIENAGSVFRYANLDESSISKEAAKVKKKSKNNPDKVFHMERDDGDDYYIKNGNVMLFYEDNLVEKGDELVPGKPASDIWTDVMPNDLHNEGGVKLRKGKKPEKLLHRIIQMGSEEGDLVLDFFLGSGTTAAVAHKTGRQYIGLEQLDYGENSAVERLKNVINGEDDRGISKRVNWDEGGDFVYAELMKWNANFLEEIQDAEDSEELEEIWEEMKENAFLSYRVDVEEFEENTEEFKDLSLENQKEFLKEVLDQNQLYVNYSEIEDSDYDIDEETIELNRKFYEGE